MSAATRSEAAAAGGGTEVVEPAAAPVLELEGVRRDFGEVAALDGVDLTVSEGQLVAIVGPSGSGKSTLLHVMGTLERPSAGIVRIDGTDVTRLSERRLSGVRASRIGFVFQQFHLLDGLSAQANVEHALVFRGVAPPERRRRAAAALERVGLSHRLTHRPTKLSGGERQRVAIARALVGDPAFVLADEPTGNLDSRTSEAIVALLLELNADGATVVVITHDREVAAHLPRRLDLRDGRIVGDSDAPAEAAATEVPA